MSSDPNLNLVLGQRVKNIRCEKKITREYLAEKTEVSARFLADVESGKVGVSLSTLKSICRVLCVSSDYLLGIVKNSDQDKCYAEIENRLRQIDEKFLPNLNKIIAAFADAVDCEKR